MVLLSLMWKPSHCLCVKLEVNKVLFWIFLMMHYESKYDILFITEIGYFVTVIDVHLKQQLQSLLWWKKHMYAREDSSLNYSSSKKFSGVSFILQNTKQNTLKFSKLLISIVKRSTSSLKCWEKYLLLEINYSIHALLHL